MAASQAYNPAVSEANGAAELPLGRRLAQSLIASYLLQEDGAVDQVEQMLSEAVTAVFLGGTGIPSQAQVQLASDLLAELTELAALAMTTVGKAKGMPPLDVLGQMADIAKTGR
jgi:hypothetical protein